MCDGNMNLKTVVRVTEFAGLVARRLGISEAAARKRIYNRINNGAIRARKVLSALVIDSDEARRIIEGTDINEP